MIKKLIAILLIFTSHAVFSQETTPKFVKLTQANIAFLEAAYNWKDEKLLIINFIMPRSKCHYDNYKRSSRTVDWWNRFYASINLSEAANRFVFADTVAAIPYIDFKLNFPDKDNFLLKEFFQEAQSCVGFAVIDKHGSYKYKPGEYSREDVQKYIEEMRLK